MILQAPPLLGRNGYIRLVLAKGGPTMIHPHQRAGIPVRGYLQQRKEAVPKLGTTEGWKPVEGHVQTHTFPGGWMHDPKENRRYYVKTPKDPIQARAEYVANRLYRRAGVLAPDMRLVYHQGKLAVASEAIPGAKPMTPGDLATHPQVRRGFVADAWLGNWDAPGMGYSNLLGDPHGNVWRIDHGGSLHYRAQGQPKSFPPYVYELDSMRDPSANPEGAAVFGKVGLPHLIEGAKRVARVTDAQIDQAVTQAGYQPDYAQIVASVLKARRDWIANRYLGGATV